MAERPTPHSIAVCTLITLQATWSQQRNRDSNNARDLRQQQQHSHQLYQSHQRPHDAETRIPPPPPQQRRRRGAGGGGGKGGKADEFYNDHEDDDDVENDGPRLAKLVQGLVASPSCSQPDPFLIGRGDAHEVNDDDGSNFLLSLLSQQPMMMSLPNLLRHMRSTCRISSTTCLSLLKKLGLYASSIDAVVDFFHEARELTLPGGGGKGGVDGDGNDSTTAAMVDRDSTQGVYLRKQRLGFDLLSFESVSRLWRALREYVAEGSKFNFANDCYNFDEDDGHGGIRNSGRECRSGASSGSFGMVTSSSSSSLYPSSSSWPLPPRYVEGIVRRQCLTLSRNLGRNVSYQDVEDFVQTFLLPEYPELPPVHYLRYLNALHHGERVDAMENLHRYFDYAMIHERRLGGGGVGGGGGAVSGSRGGSSGASNHAHAAASGVGGGGGTMMVQYAAVELAALHHQFGHFGLSAKAAEEAVRVAQQNFDGCCVAYAMGWLSQSQGVVAGGGSGIGGSSSGDDDQELLLRRSAIRAVRMGLPALASGSALALSGRLALSSCFSPSSSSHLGESLHPRSPRYVWDSIASATSSAGAVFGGRGGASSVGSQFGGRRTAGIPATSHHHQQLPGSDQYCTYIPADYAFDETLSVLAKQTLVAAGTWETFGHIPFASLSASTVLHCYGHLLTSAEVGVAVEKLALRSLHGDGSGIGVGVTDDDGKSDGVSLIMHDQRKQKHQQQQQQQHQHSQGRKIISTSGTSIIRGPRGGKGGSSAANPPRLSSSSSHEAHQSRSITSCAYAVALRKLALWSRSCERTGGGSSKDNDETCGGAAGEGNNSTTTAAALILHEWAVRRHDLNHARALSLPLLSSSPLVGVGGVGGGTWSVSAAEETVRGLSQHCFLLSRQGCFDRAKVILKRLLSWCREVGGGGGGSTMHGARARLLLQLASVQLEAGGFHSASSFVAPRRPVVDALPALLECISLCERLSIDSLHAAALTLLGRVHLGLGNTLRSKALIKSSLPFVLQNAPLSVQGEAWLTLAKCHLMEVGKEEASRVVRKATASKSTSGTPMISLRSSLLGEAGSIKRRERRLRLTLSQIEESIKLFRRTQDAIRLREALYLQARVCHGLPGGKAKRDAAARAYRQVCSRMVRSATHCPPASLSSRRHGSAYFGGTSCARSQPENDVLAAMSTGGMERLVMRC